MTVVYIDSVLFLNFLLNLLLLYVTSRLTYRRAGVFRLCLGAGMGALYALLAYWPPAFIMFTMPGKLLFSLAMTAAVFRVKSPRALFSTFLCFFCVSFSVAGGVSMLKWGMGDDMYAPIGVMELLTYAAACSGLVWGGIAMLYRRMGASNLTYRAEIELLGKRCVVSAMVDTANSLRDPLTGKAVTVADMAAVKSIFPPELKSYILSGDSRGLEESPLRSRLHMIPYRAVGVKEGLLFAFRPDSIFIEGREGAAKICDALIAISPHPLTGEGMCGLLLHPSLVEGITGGPKPQTKAMKEARQS